MNVPDAPAERLAAIRSEAAAGTRLHGGWLVAARAAWLAVAGLSVTLFTVSIPVRYTQLLTLSSLPLEVTADEVRASLAQFGLSTGVYAASYLALYVALALACVVVGGVIF